MTLFYLAVVEPTKTGFSAYFPDLPGCVTAGATLRETLERAADALALHAQGLAEDGSELPEPSAEADAEIDDDIEVAARVLIPVEPPGATARINLTIDKGLLTAADRAAAARGQSRSGFVADGIRRLLAD